MGLVICSVPAILPKREWVDRRFYHDNGVQVALAQALGLALEISQFPCLYGNLRESISIMI